MLLPFFKPNAMRSLTLYQEPKQVREAKTKSNDLFLFRRNQRPHKIFSPRADEGGTITKVSVAVETELEVTKNLTSLAIIRILDLGANVLRIIQLNWFAEITLITKKPSRIKPFAYELLKF